MPAAAEIPRHEPLSSRCPAGRGRERPPVGALRRAPASGQEKAPAGVSSELQKLARSVWEEPPPEVELVNAARLAEIAAEVEARRRRDRLAWWRLLGYVAAAVVAVILLAEAWQFFGNGRPSPARLASAADGCAREVLTALGAAGTPLRLERADTELVRAAGARRADYEVVVTLRLRENLYAPADSNGAQPYLQLQRSLREAGDQMRRERLFLGRPDLADPVELPLLLAPVHRAGERLVVRVPLAARRVGRRWQLAARPEEPRVDGRGFAGRVRGDYGGKPVLVFGSAEARERMQPLMEEARRFILAVRSEAGRPRPAAKSGAGP